MIQDYSAWQLADALTVAGAGMTAALIVGIVALLKNLRGIGPWLDRGNEPLVVYVLAALTVVGALAQTVHEVTPQAIATGIIGWYFIALGAMGLHDKSPAATSLVFVQKPAPVFPATEDSVQDVAMPEPPAIPPGPEPAVPALAG